MNLSQNPTREQLETLIAGSNDNDGHHILWVERDGEVHLSLLPQDQMPNRFEHQNGAKLKFRLETFGWGMGYTGPVAAQDQKEMTRLFERIMRLWKENFTGYSDASEDI